MQNLESNKENKNPDNFLNTSSATSTTANLYQAVNFSNNINATDDSAESTPDIPDTKSSTGATRPKFSFASDYTPARHFTGLSASYDYNSHLPISVPSFAVLNNDYASSTSFSNKPNAIVHPIRRAEQAAVPKSYNGYDQELRVTGYNPSLSVTYPQLGASNARHFAEELNRKLSHLSSSQGSRDIKNSSQHVGRANAFFFYN